MEDDGFKLVKNQRRRTRSGNARAFLDRIGQLDHHTTICLGSISLDNIDTLLEQTEKCCKELRENYLTHMTRSLTNCLNQRSLTTNNDNNENSKPLFDEIVCFGLGNFTKSITSLYQFSLLVIILKELKYCKRIRIYDPCFTEFEIEALRSDQIGFELIESNTECRYPIRDNRKLATMFFMPHMYAIHYNNLLESNWHNLKNVVLYGNSFDHLLSTNEVEQFDNLALLRKQSKYSTMEHKVSNNFIFNDVFNNLSIHAFAKIFDKI